MSLEKNSAEFSGFLSGVASRLRHDLKGGLITLRMGLEALPEEEELKPLLIERTQHLEGLADKLVLLLRMGQMQPRATRLSALLGEFRRQAGDRFPEIEIQVDTEASSERPNLDGDALIYALLELVENAVLAGATELRLLAQESAEGWTFSVTDNGKGLLSTDTVGSLSELGFSRWERPGLGLAIARRYVQAQGGDLALSLSPHGGASVVLHLGGQSA